ncbi:MAG: glycoside hydrolase family 13 protein [Oscillospiraceae bacterium]|jgi:4-alpha-glucanotransferase
MQEIYNSWKNEYKSVFGALKVGQTCSFKIKIPHVILIDSTPVMIIFRNGFKERFLTMTLLEVTDEYTEYVTTYTPTLMGVHYYYFGMIKNGIKSYIKKATASQGDIGDGELFQLTVYDDIFETPEFIKGGIMYQIFPDRFSKSNAPKENVPTDRYIHENWEETPFFRPDEHGVVKNNDYFGGDLKGIEEKLDYIKSLGVTCIYLNPIFEAHENHRYNTADYMKVDPLLGTNDDFKELCIKAKRLGISIILDGVFNHTGADSIYFNKFNRYDTIGAYNSITSDYYPWYSFNKHPDIYESWWGISTLPNVNETNRDYINFICGDNGVLKYWLSMGAAGYRLDVADELPDPFLDELNRCVKDWSHEKIIIGEVWEDASNKEAYGVRRRYLLGQQLDSVMNYPFRDAILSYLKYGCAESFRNKIMTILENYPKPSIDCLMNLLSTHDIMRAITFFGGESSNGKSKDWQAEKWLTTAQYDQGKKLLKAAMVLQYFLPGVPCIYYGDEAGLQGYGDPFNRRCYPWGKEDEELLDYVRYLGRLREELSEYMTYGFEFIKCDSSCTFFVRKNDDKESILIIALNRTSQAMSIDVSREFDKKYQKYTDYNVIKGSTENTVLTIEAYDFAVITAKKQNPIHSDTEF